MSVVSYSYKYLFRGAIVFSREGGSTFFSRKKCEDFRVIYIYFKELKKRLTIIITNTYKKYLKTHILFRAATSRNNITLTKYRNVVEVT